MAASGIVLDEAPVRESMGRALDAWRRAVQDRAELGMEPVNIAQYRASMSASLPASLAPETRSKLEAAGEGIMSVAERAMGSPEAIDAVRDKISSEIQGLLSASRQDQLRWSDVRNFYRLLVDLDEHLAAAHGGPTDVEAEVAQYAADLEAKRTQGVAQFEALKAELGRFLGATGLDATIRLVPNLSQDQYGSDSYYPLNFTMDVQLAGGFEDMPPNMTLFANEDDKGNFLGNYQVDDVLEWADTDFFQDDAQRTAYFQLVEFARSGRLPSERKGGKFVTLYRGMSPEEHLAWERGQAIPRGKFFASQPTAQFAQDIAGQFPELFSFRVREDAVVETSPGTFQTMTETTLKGRRIVPVE
jgi:hypothetical protein